MKFERYYKHKSYSFTDGDCVEVTLEGTDPKRLDRFWDYLTIGMCMAVSENSDLLSELMDRCQEVADDE